MSKEYFNSANITPKFEFSDDPAHRVEAEDINSFYYQRFSEISKLYPYKRFSSAVIDGDPNHKPLRRIRVLRDFGDVKKGDFGGYLQDADFLSHDGDCWIYDDAMVVGYFVQTDKHTGLITELSGNAKLYDQVIFSGGLIADNVQVRGTVKCNRAHLSGNTKIRKRRHPFKISGRMHDNHVEDVDAAESFLIAAEREFHLNNPLLTIVDGIRIDYWETKREKIRTQKRSR